MFQARFIEALLVCARRKQPMAVYMMDMDGLKRINDTHGHLLGAHTIATVGVRLGAIVQKAGGVVSRFGGDEFSAFVPNCSRDAGLALGETMRCAVADERSRAAPCWRRRRSRSASRRSPTTGSWSSS